jgi:acyl carrier protein
VQREQIIEQVNAVLMEGFEVDPAKLRADAHLYHDLGIDSLDAIDMLVFIEEKIGRTVDGTLFKGVRKVEDIYDVMEQVLTGRVPERAAPLDGASAVDEAASAPPATEAAAPTGDEPELADRPARATTA